MCIEARVKAKKYYLALPSSATQLFPDENRWKEFHGQSDSKHTIRFLQFKWSIKDTDDFYCET